MNLFGFVLHLLMVVVLTVLTQVGGMVWLLAVLIAASWKNRTLWPWLGRSLLLFLPLYGLVALAVLPKVAGKWGKTPLPVWGDAALKPASLLYPILNRHYVTPAAKEALTAVAAKLQEEYPGAEVGYLDASFPLLDSFPLLPHLSHSDGRKVDLAFFYRRADGTATNEKASRTGYGVFEGPTEIEQAMADECHSKGHWQYSYPKYLSMGVQSHFSFDAERTQKLLQLLLGQSQTEKIFLEPHLKQRLGFAKADKIRFHGCEAVRHDDHIHVQVH